MAQHTVHRLACLVALLAATTSQDQTRWSRQISSYTSDISDWVPLPGPVEREPPKALPPIKRQAVAEPRILTEPFPGFTRPTGFAQDFPPRNYYNSPANRQLYLQSVPSAPQNYLTDSGFGQSIRFGLSQPNFPLNQGFVSPQFAFDGIPPGPPLKPQTRPQPPVAQNPIKFDNFAKIPLNQAKPFITHGQGPSHISQAQPQGHIGQAPSHIGQAPSHISQGPSHIGQAPSHIGQGPSHISQVQGHNIQLPKVKAEEPKFVDGYRADNKKKAVQSLQKIKFDNYDKAPKVETIPSKPKVEREEVQLLYVPVESLNRGQFNFRSPLTTSQVVNPDLYSQNLPKPNPLKQPFSSELAKPPAKPIDTFSAGQDYFSNYDVLKDDQIPKYSTVASPFPSLPPTTPKPKKLKPHQPPLAIFLTQEARKNHQIKVGDVLSSLKNAETIAVLDTVNPLNAPKVFIGPSSLKPPENYVRFELPYLSNIENSDKKKLPFFVAPLSYNTPQGFAKIPFPSPHVGSVVINSQIKETSQPAPVRHSSPAANINLNAYTLNQHEQKPVTQKPSFTYYSTASPKTNPPAPANPKPQYYSFEPQSVSAIPPPKEQNILNAPAKTGSYFLSNVGDQYNSQYVNFPSPVAQEPVREYNKRIQPETTTAPRTTVTTTTTRPPSTYPSQMLETHNPYSINQAFHFSTPLDYHNYYDDPYATPDFNSVPKVSPTPSNPPSSQPPRPEEVVTEKQTHHQQSSPPTYLQNYTPEIHYEAEVPNSRYPVYNNNEYTTKPEVSSENYQTVSQAIVETAPPTNSQNYHVGSQENVEYNPPYENLTETIINKITGPSEGAPPKQIYEQYESNYESEEAQQTSSTSTTTTTRRTPLRTRGRPRYTTTTPRSDSSETSTRTTITRRPLRERRPLPPRSRYEPNKITTEKSTRKPSESAESTTKSSRTRTRGRVQYKPSENDEVGSYSKRNKGHSTKEEDLAYQRDVLHQNYPVTLMERMSTVDIEAITEPTQKLSSAGESYDTEQAYAHDSASSLSYPENTGSKEDTPAYPSAVEYQTEATYVPKQPSTQSEEYFYQTRSSSAPIQAIYDESVEEKPKQTTAGQRPEVVSFVTEPTNGEKSGPNYSVSNEHLSTKQEEQQTSQDIEITKVASQELSHETETEENIVQTTPSYNRVRVRPGVVRQYHQASSTERSRPERRKPPVQAITYRPAFDRRRTTMRIEEIEADLKTKQVHARPEQDYKHPVYKPDATTEPSVTTSSSVDSNTKRGHFRRRRPVYTTTSTEAATTRKSTYEVKNRFRGRRPTEKPTEKPEVQTDAPTSTVRNTPFRYSHRPRLSERYNKKPEADAAENEDQDSNYSINRPKYVAPESEQWSPKFSVDTFKPYNPNDIIEDVKAATTEHKDDEDKDEGDLDIITARNDYDDILISVTPASNNRGNKKLPDIPPTLEAFVDQSKTTKSDSPDTMSTFETMLEEVMKSLEEQDEDEYTSNVMKHRGGEIGEIPPERIITSGEEVTQKATLVEEEVTTAAPIEDDSTSLSKVSY